MYINRMKSNVMIISENQYKDLDAVCTGLRAMLIASINTAKENVK